MTGFSRSLRALEADRRGAAGLVLAAALIALAAWTAWFAFARISLYEVTPSARLEVERAAYPVQSPMLGRVLRTTLEVGRPVAAGEVLVELDTSAEQFQTREAETRLASLAPEVAALRAQIDSEQRARAEEQQAARVAVEEARAQARQSEAPAQYDAAEELRLKQLHTERLIPEREYAKARADAQQSRLAVEREQVVIRRIEQEQRTRETDRQSRIRKLESDIVHLEGEMATARSTIQRLRNEIEKRTVRAPISGRLGEVAELRIGAVLQEGEKVGAILPDGQVLVVAQFPPAAALGRIAAGQPARLRLDGFPWAQWGVLKAVVGRVAGEVRDGSVRVELALDSASRSRIPLQHGLPGSVEVEVERISPAAFVARVAGRMLAAPRPSQRNGQ